MTYFIRVRSGVVIEKGNTDPDAFAAMQALSSEYVDLPQEQQKLLNLGDPAP